MENPYWSLGRNMHSIWNGFDIILLFVLANCYNSIIVPVETRWITPFMLTNTGSILAHPDICYNIYSFLRHISLNIRKRNSWLSPFIWQIKCQKLKNKFNSFWHKHNTRIHWTHNIRKSQNMTKTDDVIWQSKQNLNDRTILNKHNL